MYDYLNDPIGKICLELAVRSKAQVGFGAVLISDHTIVGKGWNRRSTEEERYLLTHVDCAIHAEQACILDALFDSDIRGSSVYVLGKVLQGKNKGQLTTREERVFICHKCPHAFMAYDISVYIPHVSGWQKMTATEAMESGKSFYHKGHWKKFATG